MPARTDAVFTLSVRVNAATPVATIIFNTVGFNTTAFEICPPPQPSQPPCTATASTTVAATVYGHGEHNGRGSDGDADSDRHDHADAHLSAHGDPLNPLTNL